MCGLDECGSGQGQVAGCCADRPELQEVKECANQIKKRDQTREKNILFWTRYWAWYQGSSQQTNALCPAGQVAEGRCICALAGQKAAVNPVGA